MVFTGSSPITTTSPSSKAHQKSGPFAPPALPGLNAPTTGAVGSGALSRSTSPLQAIAEALHLELTNVAVFSCAFLHLPADQVATLRCGVSGFCPGLLRGVRWRRQRDERKHQHDGPHCGLQEGISSLVTEHWAAPLCQKHPPQAAKPRLTLSSALCNAGEARQPLARPRFVLFFDRIAVALGNFLIFTCVGAEFVRCRRNSCHDGSKSIALRALGEEGLHGLSPKILWSVGVNIASGRSASACGTNHVTANESCGVMYLTRRSILQLISERFRCLNDIRLGASRRLTESWRAVFFRPGRSSRTRRASSSRTPPARHSPICTSRTSPADRPVVQQQQQVQPKKDGVGHFSVDRDQPQPRPLTARGD